MASTKKISRQVKIKAKKASTYAALSGLAGGLAPLFPPASPYLAAASLLFAAIGSFMPQADASQAGAP